MGFWTLFFGNKETIVPVVTTSVQDNFTEQLYGGIFRPGAHKMEQAADITKFENGDPAEPAKTGSQHRLVVG